MVISSNTFSTFGSPVGKHEVKQGVEEDISNMNSAYFFPKFTLLWTWEATTIVNTSQPPPPVSNTRGTPCYHTRPHRRKHKHWYYSQGLRCWHRAQTVVVTRPGVLPQTTQVVKRLNTGYIYRLTSVWTCVGPSGCTLATPQPQTTQDVKRKR